MKPWKPATTAISPRAKPASSPARPMARIRAEPCAPSVLIGTCQPCQERAGDADFLQCHRQQAGGHLFARGDDGVIFALVAQRRRFLAPTHEFIGFPGHCRHDDRDIETGVEFPFNMARDISNALDIGDRGAAEFHDKTRLHGKTS